MRNLFSYLVSGATLATTLFTMNACSGDDYSIYSDIDIYQGVKKENYADAFVKRFGKVDANQSWDFSSYALRMRGFTDNPSAQTRALAGSGATDVDVRTVTDTNQPIYKGGNAISIDNGKTNKITTQGRVNTKNVTTWSGDAPTNWYQVQNATLTWMDEQLPEGEDNRSKGNPFMLGMPENYVAIVPIYQGQAGMNWDLHLVGRDSGNALKDYQLWSRSSDLIYKNPAEADNGYWLKPDGNGGSYTYEHTVNKSAIAGRPIIIKNGSITSDFLLYLKVTQGDGGSKYADTGAEQRSDQGMMLALNCPRPDGLDNYVQTLVNSGLITLPAEVQNRECNAMIIGCEDANLAGTDHDINDVVFLMIGFPKLPEIKETVIKKRYLIEDLGNYDWDFNDIVVDVTQVNESSWSTGSTSKTTAKITSICGTLPFEVKVGNTTLTNGTNGAVVKPTELYSNYETLGVPNHGYQPGWAEQDVEGWDPKQNNIVVRVYDKNPNYTDSNHTPNDKKSGENDYNVFVETNFPKNGEVPMMLAVDQTRNWNNEGVEVTWWPLAGGGSSSGSTDPDPGTGGGTTGPTTYKHEFNYTPTVTADGGSGDAAHKFKVNLTEQLLAHGYDGTSDLTITVSVSNSTTYMKGILRPNSSVTNNDHAYPKDVEGDPDLLVLGSSSGIYSMNLRLNTVNAVVGGVDLRQKAADASDPLIFRSTWFEGNLGAMNLTFKFTWTNTTPDSTTPDSGSTTPDSGSGTTIWDNNGGDPVSLAYNGAGQLQISGTFSVGDVIKIDYVDANNGTIQAFQSWANQQDYTGLNGSGTVTYTITQNNVTQFDVQGENVKVSRIYK